MPWTSMSPNERVEDRFVARSGLIDARRRGPPEGFVPRQPLPEGFERSPLPTFSEATEHPALNPLPQRPGYKASRALVDALVQPFMDAYHASTGRMTEQEQKDFAVNAAIGLIPFGRARPTFAPERGGGGSGGRTGRGRTNLPMDDASRQARARELGYSDDRFGGENRAAKPRQHIQAEPSSPGIVRRQPALPGAVEWSRGNFG